MKSDIHPNYRPVKVICSCGYTFDTRSTAAKETLHVEICSNCHPFYTGKQKAVDTAGRVEKFQKKYSSTKNRTQQLKLKTKKISVLNLAVTDPNDKI